MNLLFVGDVVGKPGRRAVARLLPTLIDRHRVDYVVVNIENAAGGFGITPGVMAELMELPIDCFTSGNHIWDKKEGVAFLAEEPRILRPANYPAGAPGRGLHVGETAGGIPVATINLEGRIFMNPLESPFVAAERLLSELDEEVRVVVVDFHAEATSEKQALGFFLDGKVSAVIGTHTHAPTADERVLPEGTAFQTDTGMTGPYESVIGMRAPNVVRRFLEQVPISFDVAKRDVRLAGALIDVDEVSGKARLIERIMMADQRD
jgi:metallophosphoesterase (TIGR00282 family)